jgi:hypothetical protein
VSHTPAAGLKSIEAIEERILAANLERERASSNPSSSSSSSQPQAADLPSSLSGCLLAGCGLSSLSLQEAQQVWHAWTVAQDEAVQRHGPNINHVDWLPALRGPQWQQPPGLKKLGTKQQAGVDQLRGLVQLATAASTMGWYV